MFFNFDSTNKIINLGTKITHIVGNKLLPKKINNKLNVLLYLLEDSLFLK